MFKFLADTAAVRMELLSGIPEEEKIQFFAYRKDSSKKFANYAVVEKTEDKLVGLRLTEDLTECRKRINLNCKNINRNEIKDLIENGQFQFGVLVSEANGEELGLDLGLIGKVILFGEIATFAVPDCPYLISFFDPESNKFVAKVVEDTVPKYLIDSGNWREKYCTSISFTAEYLQQLEQQEVLKVNPFPAVDDQEMSSF